MRSIRALTICAGLCLFAGLCFFAGPALPAGSAPQSPKKGQAGSVRGEKFALIIGINDYQYTAKLKGCEPDAMAIKRTLVGRLGFKDDAQHIRLITSKEASKENILSAFRQQLIANARANPDGFFFFHYSGHGSQVRDQDGDEGDGKDETLVPVDAKGSAASQITDDEMQALLKELTALSSNVFLVFDCCHSGTNTRSQEFAVRRAEFAGAEAQAEAKAETPAAPAVNRGPAGALLAGGSESGGDSPLAGGQHQQAMLASGQNYCAITGCSAGEVSLEHDFRGARHGLLTYVLLDTLNTCPPNMTYRELWERVKNGVNSIEPRQNPTAEGDLNRIIFGTSDDRLRPFNTVKSVIDGNTITIDAGASLGIKKGTQMAVYKATARKLAGHEGLLTVGLVEAVTGFDARVRLRKSLSAAELKQARVVNVTPYFGIAKASVGIDAAIYADRKLSALMPKLKHEINVKPELDPAGDLREPFSSGSARWDYVVTAATAEEFVRFGGQLRAGAPAPAGRCLYVATRAGMPLFNFFVSPDDPQAVSKICEVVQKRLRQEAVRNLNNQLSSMNDSLDVFIEKVEVDSDGTVRPAGGSVRAGTGATTFKVGEKFRLSMRNKSSVPVYVTVVSLDSTGGISVLLPVQGAPDQLLPDRLVKTPGYLEVEGPAGVESFKFIVTTSPVDFHRIEQPSVSRGDFARGERTSDDPHDASGLDTMLLAGMYMPDETTRSVTLKVAPPVSSWFTQQVDFQVEE